jgi:hypothetical protein
MGKRSQKCEGGKRREASKERVHESEKCLVIKKIGSRVRGRLIEVKKFNINLKILQKQRRFEKKKKKKE